MKFSSTLVWIMVILAIILLLCLLPMPYGYYTLVRFFATIFFAIMAYQYYEGQNKPLMITFGALALLFQPFMKLTLGRGIWNFIDVVVAMFLFYLVLKRR